MRGLREDKPAAEPERRRQRRQLHSKPIAEALAAWADSTVRQLSRKSELAQAFRYMRARWNALVRCFDTERGREGPEPAHRRQPSDHEPLDLI
jgi:transposase